MQWCKQSTAATLIVGPILDSTGAEYTGAVIGDLSIAKHDAGTLTAMAAAATLTHLTNGEYALVLTTGNTDTLGRCRIVCNKSSYQMPAWELMILQATVYDALVTNAAGGANGLVLSLASNQVNLGQALGQAVTLDSNNVLNVSAKYVGGTLQTARDIGLSVLLSNGTGTGQLDFTSGVVKANATQWLGGTIPAVNITGVPLVDAKYLLGTIFATPNTAGLMDVNAKQAGATAWGSGAITAGSIGAAALNGKGDWNTTTPPSAAAIATGVWTDTTASDFTTALSVGKSLMNGVTLGTGLTIVSVSGAVGSVTGLTASNLDATISSRMATYTQPSGFLAATFPSGTVANTTNITAGIITTVTNLTNAPTSGDFTATMKAATLARVTLVDTLTTYTGNTPSTGDPYLYLTTNLGLLGANLTAVPALILDLASGIETSVTLRQAIRAIAAVACGKIADAGTGTETYKSIGGTTTRVVGTIDGSGNRSAMTLTL